MINLTGAGSSNNGLGIDSFEFATSPAHGAILAFVYLLLLGGGLLFESRGPEGPPPSPAKKNSRNQRI